MPDAVEQTAERGHPGPASSLLDPRVLQILNAEHSSLLSARALAYNEAFVRAGMFLTFLSMSFVALALMAPAFPNIVDILPVAAIVLAFDLVVGLTTYGRIIGTNHEDYLAVYGMARIRHGYVEIAPVIRPLVTSGIHDDLAGVMVSYGNPSTKGLGAAFFQLTTSASMVGLIVSMIGGVLALVVALTIGAALEVATVGAVIAGIGVFVALAVMTIRFYFRVQGSLQVLYPTPKDDPERVAGSQP